MTQHRAFLQGVFFAGLVSVVLGFFGVTGPETTPQETMLMGLGFAVVASGFLYLGERVG